MKIASGAKMPLLPCSGFISHSRRPFQSGGKMLQQNSRACYQAGSTVRDIEVSIMGIRAAPRVTVHEGVSDSVVGVVPGTRCNPIPIAVRVGTLDRWDIHLTRDLHPRPCGYFVGS